jgi:hypothetical protein
LKYIFKCIYVGVFAFGWAPPICHYLRICKRDWDKLTLKDKGRNKEDPCMYIWVEGNFLKLVYIFVIVVEEEFGWFIISYGCFLEFKMRDEYILLLLEYKRVLFQTWW